MIPKRLETLRVAGRRDPEPSGSVLDAAGNNLGRVHGRHRPTPAPGGYVFTAEVADYSLGTRYASQEAAVHAIRVFHAAFPDTPGECVRERYLASNFTDPVLAQRCSENITEVRPMIEQFMQVWCAARGF